MEGRSEQTHVAKIKRGPSMTALKPPTQNSHQLIKFIHLHLTIEGKSLKWLTTRAGVSYYMVLKAFKGGGISLVDIEALLNALDHGIKPYPLHKEIPARTPSPDKPVPPSGKIPGRGPGRPRKLDTSADGSPCGAIAAAKSSRKQIVTQQSSLVEQVGECLLQAPVRFRREASSLLEALEFECTPNLLKSGR